MSEWYWRPFSERPAWDAQPGRQVIRIEGERTHHGGTWHRVGFGVVGVERDGPHNYVRDDIMRILDRWDMDHHSWFITHWMPEVYPPLPEPPQKAKDDE